MKKTSIDFNHMRSKRYQTGRILSAPGIWSIIYRDRLNVLGRFRSAILFPEMLLGLNQSDIYYVEFSDRPDLIIKVIKLSSQSLRFECTSGPQKTFDQDDLYKFESLNCSKDDIRRLYFHKFGNRYDFATAPVFCSKSDVRKYANELLENNLSNL